MRSVDVHPLDDAPLTRAFTDGCWTVAELYSLTLARTEEPIKATVSWTRIFVDRRIRPGAPSRIEEEPPDGFGFSDGMRCAVDPAVLATEALLRPRRYLEWLHERMLELARARNWDQSVLHQAFADCMEAGLVLVQSSTPRSSPDRRHRATLTLRTGADRAGTLELRIVDRNAVERGRTTADDACSVDTFRKLTRQLRWLNPTEVTTDDDDRTLGLPGLYRLTAHVGEVVDIDSACDGTRLLSVTAEFDDVLGDSVFDAFGDEKVCGETCSTDPTADEDVEYEPDVLPPPRLTLVGGGPIGGPWGITERWSHAFDALLVDLDKRAEWRAWWETEDLPECRIQYYADADLPATRVRIRRTAAEVRVSVDRPREVTDPVAEARADAEAVIRALTQRFRLPPAPPLDRDPHHD